MKFPAIVLCVVVCTCLVRAQVSTPESLTDAQLVEVVGRVKQAPASGLDSALPAIAFAKWLEMEAGPGSKIGWALRYPAVDSGEARSEVPTCVEADAVMKDGRSIIVFIAVGTPGMVGDHKARVFRVDLMKQEEDVVSLHHLREIPKTLRRLEKKDTLEVIHD